MKAYYVMTIDLWSNIEEIGLFKDLKSAEKIILENIDFTPAEPFELNEYISTFGTIFDTTIEDADEDNGEWLRVFGFIFNTENEAGVLMKFND